MMLWSVETRGQIEVLQDLLRICFPGRNRILDPTYGMGGFWKGETVIRGDLSPSRAKDVVLDFCRLPVRDQGVDIVVFDPPFQPETVPGIIGKRFTKSRPGTHNLKKLVQEGASECWRVARRGLICKVQDYIHSHKPVWMSSWLWEVLGVPYEHVHVLRKGKLRATNWGEQKSAYRNHTTFWVWSREQHR